MPRSRHAPAPFSARNRQAIGPPPSVERRSRRTRLDSPPASRASRSAASGQRAEDLARHDRRREERDRQQRPAELLPDDRQFGQATAGTADVLGDAQAGQAHVRAEQPPRLLVVASPGVESTARRREAA